MKTLVYEIFDANDDHLAKGLFYVTGKYVKIGHKEYVADSFSEVAVITFALKSYMKFKFKKTAVYAYVHERWARTGRKIKND